MEEKEFLTTDAASAKSCTRTTIYRLIETNKINTKQVGKRRLVKNDEKFQSMDINYSSTHIARQVEISVDSLRDEVKLLREQILLVLQKLNELGQSREKLGEEESLVGTNLPTKKSATSEVKKVTYEKVFSPKQSSKTSDPVADPSVEEKAKFILRVCDTAEGVLGTDKHNPFSLINIDPESQNLTLLLRKGDCPRGRTKRTYERIFEINKQTKVFKDLAVNHVELDHIAVQKIRNRIGSDSDEKD